MEETSRICSEEITAVKSSGAAREAVVAPAADRLGIVVLGMHRSGTSALAGTLGLLGVTLPRDIIGAAAGNPTGHFESWGIMELDDKMLSALNTVWYDFRQISPIALSSHIAQRYRAELTAALEKQFSNTSLFVIKDPRACRFFPIWRSALENIGAPPRIVLCIRNPLEVAYSLQKRNQFAIQHGLGLWLRHVLDAEFHTRDLPRVFTNYSDFLQNWRTVIGRVEHQLQINLPLRQTDAEKDVDDFVNADLRHEVVTMNELEERLGVGGWIIPCYQALAALVQDPYDPDAMRRLDGIQETFRGPSGFFGAALTQYATELVALRQNLATQASRLSEAQTRRDAVRVEAEQLFKSFKHSLEAERRALQAAQAKADAELKQVVMAGEATIARLSSQIEAAQTKMTKVQVPSE